MTKHYCQIANAAEGGQDLPSSPEGSARTDGDARRPGEGGKKAAEPGEPLEKRASS